MRASWVLDERGEIWPEASRNLEVALNTKRRGADLTSFLVAQMGLIIVREHDGRNEILIRPEVASPIAITSLIGWQNVNRFRPTVCLDPTTPQLPQVFARKPALLEYFRDLLEARMPRPAFASHEINLDLSNFGTFWRAASEVCTAPIQLQAKLEILERLIVGNIVVAERAEHGELMLRYMSPTFSALDPMLYARAVEERSFRDAHDKAYGNRSADDFSVIARSQRPRAGSVAAEIGFHNVKRRRYFYERLMLPIASSTGRDTLLVATSHGGKRDSGQ